MKKVLEISRICNNIAMLCNEHLVNNEYKKLFHIFTNNWLSSQVQFIIGCLLSSRVFRFTPRDFFYVPNQDWMRNLVYLPVELIKAADKDGWLRSLAYFVRLKSLYKNNTHYNFTLRSLAAKVKCSPGCLSLHLKELHQKGLIVYHGRNMTFLGVAKILALMGKKQMRNIGIPVDHKNQYDILRGQIIRFNLSAQEYNIKKSGRQIQTFGDVPHTRREKTESCYVGLSALGIGNLFGLSGATGSRLRKKLAKLGLLKLKRMFSVLYENVSLKHYNSLKWTGVIPIYCRLLEGRVLLERRYSIKYIGGES